MRKHYQELMNRICLTEEMEARVLQNVSSVSHKAHIGRNLLAAAACLVLILCLPKLKQTAPIAEHSQRPEKPLLQSVSGARPAESAEALSDLLGFPLREIPTLPFTPQEVRYASYFGSVAEVVCEAADQSAVFRMARGFREVSGDDTAYPAEKRVDIQDLSVTLKGNGEDSFCLAVFEDAEYSYSIKLSAEISSQQWCLILEEFMSL